ncbi:hypothetical protein [Prescottella subtropica]|uniref:hypothetical protein n=1 Tax=Prescottella subtropica TaxID=2545757 RepID=UPI0010F610B9|nr:hypothetical protein [Prescottella subtropica]
MVDGTVVVDVAGACSEVVAGLAVVRAAGADTCGVVVVACGVVDSTVVSAGEAGAGVVVVADVVDVVSGSA